MKKTMLGLACLLWLPLACVAIAQEATAADEAAAAAPAAAAPSATPEAAPASAPAEEPAQVATIPVPQHEAVPAPVRSDEASAPAMLDTVMVTATKREANPRDLPSSVTALRGEDLEQHGYQGQEDFLKLIPGVTFSNDTITANRITIRGIGADLNTSNTTGVFLGDVPFEDPILPRVTLDPNPFDLARIEVLKGPQGTLFGGSALNGAVRYVPNDPQIGQWEAKTFFQMEDVHLGSTGPIYGAAINIPAGDKVAIRVVGFDRHSPGWVDDLQRNLNDVNQTNQSGGRALALWRPADSWKITAMGAIQDTHLPDNSITDNREGRLSRSDTPAASPIRTKYDLETLGVQYSLPMFDVLSQTSRTSKRFGGIVDASRIGNVTDRPPQSVTITNHNESQSVMQELRLTSSPDFDPRWKWMGGAFYRRVHITEVSDILASNLALPIPPAILGGLGSIVPGFGGYITEDGKLNTARGAAQPIVVSELALFGEASATFWESFEATLGLRAFRTRSDSRILFSGPLTANQSLNSGSTETVKQGTLQEHGINPHVALSYKFNRHISLYTSAARGFRFGGAQVLVGTLTSQAPDVYKSDTLWSYELGLRTQWLENTLIADVTPFLIDWINPQLQQADSTGLGSYFDNVGGARGKGVELALRYLTPLPGLALSFAGSYVDTVTTKPFTTSTGVHTQPGTRWPLAAKWQSASTISYLHPLFDSWAGGGTLVYSTISSAPNTLSYLDTVFGFKTLDVMLNLSNPEWTSKPELSLSLNNATDVRGILSGVNNPQFPKDHNYIRPRTLVARVAFAF